MTPRIISRISFNLRGSCELLESRAHGWLIVSMGCLLVSHLETQTGVHPSRHLTDEYRKITVCAWRDIRVAGCRAMAGATGLICLCVHPCLVAGKDPHLGLTLPLEEEEDTESRAR